MHSDLFSHFFLEFRVSVDPIPKNPTGNSRLLTLTDADAANIILSLS